MARRSGLKKQRTSRYISSSGVFVSDNICPEVTVDNDISAESVTSVNDNINIIPTTVNIETRLESLNRLTSLAHDNFIRHTDLLTDEKEIQANEFSNCHMNMLVDEKQVQVDRVSYPNPTNVPICQRPLNSNILHHNEGILHSFHHM